MFSCFPEDSDDEADHDTGDPAVVPVEPSAEDDQF